jgi:hypothetical protein
VTFYQQAFEDRMSQSGVEANAKRQKLNAIDPKTFGNNSDAVTQHVRFKQILFIYNASSSVFIFIQLACAQCTTGVAGLVLYRSELFYNSQANSSTAPKKSWQLILLGKEGDSVLVRSFPTYANNDQYTGGELTPNTAGRIVR